MVKRLIQSYLGEEVPNRLDNQHLAKKRIDLSGELLMNLFQHNFKNKYLPHAAILVKKLLADNVVI